MTKYQAMVQLITPDYTYWKPLGLQSYTFIGAEAEIDRYKEDCVLREKAPARTRIDEWKRIRSKGMTQ